MWGSRRVAFSSEDARLYLDQAFDRLAAAVGEPLYIATDGSRAVVTQTHVQQGVEADLRAATAARDSASLAAQLSIPRAAIEAVAPAAVAATGSFSDGVQILPPRLISAISARLSAAAEPARVADTCAAEGITIRAAEHIVRTHARDLVLAGDWIVPAALLSSRVAAVEAAMADATAPVDYAALEPSAVLRPLVKARLGVPAHEKRYVPPQFVAHATAAAAAALEAHGFVAQTELAAELDAAKFARQHDAVVVGGFVVRRAFVAAQTAAVTQQLQQQSWADLRSVGGELGPAFAAYVVANEPRLEKLRSAASGGAAARHFLVRPQLERELAERVTQQLQPVIAERAAAVKIDVTGSSELREFVDAVELPQLADVRAEVAAAGAPDELRLGDAVLAPVRSALREQAARELTPVFEAAQLRQEAQIRVYLNGVLSLTASDDAGAANGASGANELDEMAWTEWQQYVSERQYAVPATPELAQRQFRPAAADVAAARTQLLAKTRAKLAKTKKRSDAALALHLAATVYHAEHYCADGMLKLRGKAVPRLLKRFRFPASFQTLRQNLKAPTAEQLAAVKTDAEEVKGSKNEAKEDVKNTKEETKEGTEAKADAKATAAKTEVEVTSLSIDSNV